MSDTVAGVLFLVALIVALAVVHVPLGDYMYRVYSSEKDSRVERVVYRMIGADPKSEQTWGAYARSRHLLTEAGMDTASSSSGPTGRNAARR